MGKKELSALRRDGEKLKRNLEGIRDMQKLPDVLIIIDTTREAIAVAEARRLNIPTIAIVDTNANPELSTIPSPGMTTPSAPSASSCKSWSMQS